MADSATVNLPFVGTQRKEYLTVGVIFAGGYVIYRWRKAKTAAASAPAASTAGLTPAGQDASGNEVYYDAAGGLVDASGNPDTLASSVNPGGSATYTNPAPIGAVQTTPAGGGPQTDEQWTSAVEQDLEGLGYDPQTVATAVAQYLASQPLSSNQVLIIRTAFAWEGHPPQHPNLPIVTGTGGGGGNGGGGNGGGGKQLVPGTVIRVPVLLKHGMTLQSVAADNGISLAHLQAENPGATGKEGTIVNVPWLIGSHDTLQSLASHFGISVQHLEEYIP